MSQYVSPTPTTFRLTKVCQLTVTNGAIVIHTQRLKSDPGGNLLS
ncbi:nonribosomal peptide synthetase/polyketide synthase [Escherichia coli]|nr:nonribosomal peptide synthetase/polyketide synthase [Escherichia coli]